MCGRLIITDTASDLAAMFDVEHEGENLPEPSWNIAPTEQIPIVLESAKSGDVVRRLEAARWSLVPSFATELASGFPTFNARSETVGGKASFADSVVSRRALVPATGYYEWRTDGAVKTPYFIHSDDGLPLALAGLYSWWRNPAVSDTDPSRWVLSATILTQAAGGPLADLHDRMPVILAEEWWDQWLDPHTPGDQSFVDGAVAASRDAADALRFHEVAPIRGNGPELIEPAGDRPGA
ncbi:SOS response-associated peptidase [Cryobacterium sp. TMT1-21]|uniref:Abasic site processing protein n=1 Tax=Cryobacterium shii TaxID=1259235 RepID=A0AAQ2C6N1_9MICO|nr:MULTISPECIES: SOS response-associated peptidase [Cryobacterium]TFC48579.1 SOS response-associated peptidase [Cryobacterium shii]TFC81820.1 SOS response-associated peptidase [Cryobacterium sp. TmT2-59]TFD08274.1 SOS response-associated peptidase [Cryobacterium sp. TMT1-21]TFD20684.1 SOS response-associated peptidase [Cryobacterium sp. TMT4-10]TFD24666.1 SOS response-associated peptidase [Cryobacterium sp. TMT2-23]